jgi:ligand-binding sensor domain-containing protein
VNLQVQKNHLLILCMLLCLSSCTGQLSQEKTEKKIGTPVSSLEEKVMLVFQDSKDAYWFGGSEKGVYRYNKDGLILFSTADGLVSHSVLGMQEDQAGNIYFDTTEGVSKFDGKSFSTLQVKAGEPSENEWKLESGDLWFRMGWNGKGPYRYDGEELHPLIFPKNEEEDTFYAKYPNVSFSPYGIYSMYKDSKGAMWFGTGSLGLCRFDGEKVSWLYESQLTGTPAGGAFGIRSILEDEDGAFWFCNTQERFHILPGSTVREGTHYLNYKKSPGIPFTNEQGEEKFPYFMSMVKDDAGDIWMVTYEEGAWRSDGEKLIHYPIQEGDSTVLLFSIFKDNRGDIWLGTHKKGAYKYNGLVFEQFNP